jgi:hypothetical protein
MLYIYIYIYIYHKKYYNAFQKVIVIMTSNQHYNETLAKKIQCIWRTHYYEKVVVKN